MKVLMKRRKKEMLINILIILILTPLSIFFLISSSYIKTPITLQYNELSNLDYKVYLKDNSYYNTPYLEKNLQYIASLIDKIDVAFKYDYKMNRNVTYNYKYYIDAEVIVYDKNNTDKPLFKKTINLLEEQVVKGDDIKEFSIKENVLLDYDEYNTLVSQFTNEYGLNADASVTLKLYIDVSSKHPNYKNAIKTNSVMEINIPLTSKTINIGMKYNEINDSDIFKEYTSEKPINYIYLSIGLIQALLTIIFIIRLIYLIIKITNNKTEYDKTISKILSTYDRAIITTKTLFNMPKDIVVIDVENIDELVDASIRLDLPILFIEVKKGKLSWFIIRHNNDLYRLIIDSDDTKRDTNEEK